MCYCCRIWWVCFSVSTVLDVVCAAHDQYWSNLGIINFYFWCCPPFRQHQLSIWSQRAVVIPETLTCHCPPGVAMTTADHFIWRGNEERERETGQTSPSIRHSLLLKHSLSSLFTLSFLSLLSSHCSTLFVATVFLKVFASFRKPRWSLSCVSVADGPSARASWLC